MDQDTIERLERRRHGVPRYLFRAWNNVAKDCVRLSGGYEGLNTPNAITPLAFWRGTGHESVYDLSRANMTEMVLANVQGERAPYTEFSSWASSQSFALNRAAGDWLHARNSKAARTHIYISVIDTKEHWDTNQIFHVPSLVFLSGGLARFSHEYLAHGVIQGTGDVRPITQKTIQLARKIGDQYGKDFALPMCLAVLCLERRDERLYSRGIHPRTFDLILNNIKDLHIPDSWSNAKSTQADAKYVPGYGDVEQMGRLMRALSERAESAARAKEQVEEVKNRVLEAGKRGQCEEHGEDTERKRPKRQLREPNPRTSTVKTRDSCADESKERERRRWRRELRELRIEMANWWR